MATHRASKRSGQRLRPHHLLIAVIASAAMLGTLLAVGAASPAARVQGVACVSIDRSVTGVTNLTANPPQYATIGAAVTAAAQGDHICVTAGTWPEQVAISKAITLTGAGEGVTIISSPATLAVACGTDLDPATVAIVDVCSSNVTISNLTIDGDTAGDGDQSGMPVSGSTDFFGLVVHGGATATISDVTVTNVHTANPAHWGQQSGDAIWVAPASTLHASHIHVLKYQKSGVVAYGSEAEVANLTLAHSLVEGDRLAGMNDSIAMNGITIARANATLHAVTSRGNQCNAVNCDASPEAYNSGGLLIYDWDVSDPVMNVSVNDSVFTENDIGVYTDVTNPSSTIAVTASDISGNRWFGVNLDEGHADFTGNDITSNGINGIIAIAGSYGIAPVHATFVQNVITGNGSQDPTSGAIRLVDHSASDLSMSADISFSNNAIIGNTGVAVANLSAAGVLTGTGTWWGADGQPVDVAGSFTSDTVVAPDALATDVSDQIYGFAGASAVVAPSADLPLFSIISTDPSDAPTAISIDFGGVSGGGSVTAVHSDQASEGDISFGTNPSVIDIQFSGTFTGTVEICIGFDPAHYTADSDIRLFHYTGGAWIDVTSFIDVTGDRVCGEVDSLSPFAAGEVITDDADTTAPTTTAPVVSIALGSQIGSSAPLHLDWTGADNSGGSGIEGYDVQLSRNSGRTWTTVASNVDLPSVDLDAPASGTLIYQVRARDVEGNVGAWVSGEKLSLQLLKETDRTARYKGDWARLRGSQYSNNAATTAQRAGASFTLTSTGRSLGILASTGPGAGVMRISVNGTLVATVDLWAPTATVRQVVWQASWETAARRTVLLVATRASRTVHVEIDGFVTLK